MQTLAGQRIVITRSREDFEPAAQAVRQRGGIPVACPMIALVPPKDIIPLDDAIQNLQRFDWIFFTSPHAVQFFHKRLLALGIGNAPFNQIQSACVGTSTAEKLKAYNITPYFVAEKFTGENLFHEFNNRHPVKGKRFLLPLSNIARETLTNLLYEHGGEVTAITAYSNEAVTTFPVEVMEQFRNNKIDWVTFFSSSAAYNFYTILKSSPDLPANFKTASIGPSTSKTLREHNIEPTIEAQPYTLDGLLNSIASLEDCG